MDLSTLASLALLGGGGGSGSEAQREDGGGHWHGDGAGGGALAVGVEVEGRVCFARLLRIVLDDEADTKDVAAVENGVFLVAEGANGRGGLHVGSDGGLGQRGRRIWRG